MLSEVIALMQPSSDKPSFLRLPQLFFRPLLGLLGVLAFKVPGWATRSRPIRCALDVPLFQFVPRAFCSAVSSRARVTASSWAALVRAICRGAAHRHQPANPAAPPTRSH